MPALNGPRSSDASPPRSSTFSRMKWASPIFAFPEDSGIGIKPVSKSGSQRLIRAAIEYAIHNNRKSVTIVHKGNIMKFTEGAFLTMGHGAGCRRNSARCTTVVEKDYKIINPHTGEEIVPSRTASATPSCRTSCSNRRTTTSSPRSTLTATMPPTHSLPASAESAFHLGANINYRDGKAVFEATHGTAPDIAGEDKVNPCSLVLSGK